MEKPRRVSIGMLCVVVVVAVVAVDFAWWKQISGSWFESRPLFWSNTYSLLGFRGPALDMGAMPMASVLAIGLAYVLSNRGRVHHRVVGFLWGGLAGLLLYCVYCWACWILPQSVVDWSMKPIDAAAKARWPNANSRESLFFFVADIVYYSPPQFLLALVVGLICRKRDQNT